MNCVWSTGKELITDNDFCGPITIPKDAQTFLQCTTQQDDTCAKPVSGAASSCMWYKGFSSTLPVDPTKPTDPSVDPTKPTDPSVDPTKPTNGYCSPLPTITDQASKETCYKSKDKASCPTTKCMWKEVCAATGTIPTDMKCSAPYWDTQLCRYKCPPTFICLNKDKSAADVCSKNSDKDSCYKDDKTCYWGVDPSS
jgi:hypothetical protein